MPDLYSTDALLATVEDLTVPGSAMLDAFFGVQETHDTEEIHFDRKDGAKKLAPFVSPLVAGKIMQERGFSTSSFRPAYIKPKTPLDPNRPLKRAIGERIGGGELSPDARERIQVAGTLDDQVQYIRNRLEWMACEVLRTGAVTISGDGYQTVSLDFGRDSAHTVALAGGALWSAGTAEISDNLTDWSLLVAKNGGSAAEDVVMDPDAFKAFIKQEDVAGKLDRRNLTDNQIAGGAAKYKGLTYKGEFDGFRVWVYQDWYANDAGVMTPFLPSGTVIMPGRDMLGIQAFGAIRDPHAGFRSLPFYPRSWMEDDPAQRVIMTQSAPLVYMQRPNATLAATVL